MGPRIAGDRRQCSRRVRSAHNDLLTGFHPQQYRAHASQLQWLHTRYVEGAFQSGYGWPELLYNFPDEHAHDSRGPAISATWVVTSSDSAVRILPGRP